MMGADYVPFLKNLPLPKILSCALVLCPLVTLALGLF